MMRLIRQIFGVSRRQVQADALREMQRSEFEKRERQVKAKRIVLQRLVEELAKDTTAWH